MKYILLFISLGLLASCSKGEAPVQAPTPEAIETPAPVATTDSTPVTDSTSTVSNSGTHDPYYDELRKRCEEQSEDKRPGCNASVSAMEKGGYIEAENTEGGKSPPCPEGLVTDTIRSPGSLIWCIRAAQ